MQEIASTTLSVCSSGRIGKLDFEGEQLQKGGRLRLLASGCKNKTFLQSHTHFLWKICGAEIYQQVSSPTIWPDSSFPPVATEAWSPPAKCHRNIDNTNNSNSAPCVCCHCGLIRTTGCHWLGSANFLKLAQNLPRVCAHCFGKKVSTKWQMCRWWPTLLLYCSNNLVSVNAVGVAYVHLRF